MSPFSRLQLAAVGLLTERANVLLWCLDWVEIQVESILSFDLASLLNLVLTADLTVLINIVAL